MDGGTHRDVRGPLLPSFQWSVEGVPERLPGTLLHLRAPSHAQSRQNTGICGTLTFVAPAAVSEDPTGLVGSEVQKWRRDTNRLLKT